MSSRLPLTPSPRAWRPARAHLGDEAEDRLRPAQARHRFREQAFGDRLARCASKACGVAHVLEPSADKRGERAVDEVRAQAIAVVAGQRARRGGFDRRVQQRGLRLDRQLLARLLQLDRRAEVQQATHALRMAARGFLAVGVHGERRRCRRDLRARDTRARRRRRARTPESAFGESHEALRRHPFRGARGERRFRTRTESRAQFVEIARFGEDVLSLPCFPTSITAGSHAGARRSTPDRSPSPRPPRR
jgi:hypothetical protein